MEFKWNDFRKESPKESGNYYCVINNGTTHRSIAQLWYSVDKQAFFSGRVGETNDNNIVECWSLVTQTKLNQLIKELRRSKI